MPAHPHFLRWTTDRRNGERYEMIRLLLDGAYYSGGTSADRMD